MLTSKSPRKVLRLAHELAREVLPPHASRISRKDFTQAQLFACLVLREHQRKSFRGIEALLADSPQWLADVGLAKAPDHNTLGRAFDRFVGAGLARSMLDLTARLAKRRGLLKRRRGKPLGVDSTVFESRHVSRHFERRRRDAAAAAAASPKKARGRGADASTAAAAASSGACRSCRSRATAPPT